MNPIKIFKNLTINPFFKTFTIFVFTSVPGYTNWSKSSLLIYSSYTPCKLSGIFSSWGRVTLIICFELSIFLTTARTCFFIYKFSNPSSEINDFGRNIWYFLHISASRIQPNSSFDLTVAGRICPTLTIFSSIWEKSIKDSWIWGGFLLFTTLPTT